MALIGDTRNRGIGSKVRSSSRAQHLPQFGFALVVYPMSLIDVYKFLISSKIPLLIY